MENWHIWRTDYGKSTMANWQMGKLSIPGQNTILRQNEGRFQLVVSTLRQRCEYGVGMYESDKQKFSVMIFPIEERIHTELFIWIGNRGFKYKMVSRKLSDLIEEGKRK